MSADVADDVFVRGNPFSYNLCQTDTMNFVPSPKSRQLQWRAKGLVSVDGVVLQKRLKLFEQIVVTIRAAAIFVYILDEANDLAAVKSAFFLLLSLRTLVMRISDEAEAMPCL